MKFKYSIPFYLAAILFVFICHKVSFSQPRAHTGNKCIENKNLFEPLLIPAKADSEVFLKIKQKFSCCWDTAKFAYTSMLLTRGIIDTSLLTDQYFNKTSLIDTDSFSVETAFKTKFILSPLIIEGTVEKVFYADSLAGTAPYYNTCFLIKISKIIKTKYKIGIGDYVLAKTALYTETKDKDGQWNFTGPGDILFYKTGRSYLFTLDKYDFMAQYYNMALVGYKRDVYCPYAFGIGFLENDISEAFEQGTINEDRIRSFLTKDTVKYKFKNKKKYYYRRG